jgi:peptidylprolyl isomerase
MKTSTLVWALCAALSHSALAQDTTKDYESLPPDPAEAAQKLAAAAVSMTKAIELATAATGGRIVEATTNIDGEKITYDFLCSVGGVPQHVLVDGSTGAVATIKLTIADAIVVATKQVDGVVQSASAEFEATDPSYSVVILMGGKFHTVTVDANDGSIKSETVRGQFPGKDVTGDLVSLPDGLKYFDFEVGSGAAPSGPGAVVEVHYTGYLVDGTKFDSSVDRGQPASFPLANVIKGWTEGVGSMRVGGKRKLVIPYALAYGPAGRAPVIPPKATLIFDVELLRIISDPGAPAAPAAPKPIETNPTTK